jgi:hypothetical protein
LEECLQLIVAHRLYAQALQIFKPDSRGHKVSKGGCYFVSANKKPQSDLAQFESRLVNNVVIYRFAHDTRGHG